MSIDCKQWSKNKSINPSTNRKIKLDGPTYKKIQKICDENQQTQTNLDTICSEYISKYLRQENNLVPWSLKARNIMSRKIISNLKHIDQNASINTDYIEQSPYFTNIRKVGRGTFGATSTAVIKSIKEKVLFKQAVLSKDNYDKWKNNCRFEPDEYIFNGLVNKILQNNQTQNFNFTFCLFFSSNTKIRLYGKTYEGYASTTFMEFLGGGVMKIKVEQIESVLFQLLSAIYCIHNDYGLAHVDIKQNNVIWKKCPFNKGEHWIYKLNGKTYYIPNVGIIPYLIDFGNAIMYPTNGSIRNRNYKVVGNKMVEIFNIPEPLNFKTYPFLYMNFDIMNVLRMFFGGVRAEAINLFHYSITDIFDRRPKGMEKFLDTDILDYNQTSVYKYPETFVVHIFIEKYMSFFQNMIKGHLLETFDCDGALF